MLHFDRALFVRSILDQTTLSVGQLSPAEAAEIAERAACVSAGIPGARARAESAAALARRVATGSGELPELGVCGYRVLESRHRHFDIRVESKSLTVHVNGTTLATKAEHNPLVQLRVQLAD